MTVVAVMLVACAPPEGTPTGDRSCPVGYHADPDRIGHCLLDAGATLGPPTPEILSADCAEARQQPRLETECTSIYDGDLVLLEDADLEGFCDSWDCVSGGIMLGGVENPEGPDVYADDITSLEPLSCLVATRFLLITRLSQIDTISLPALRFTGGGLSVVLNPGVRTLSAPALKWISGDLSLQGNLALDSLDLPALRRVNEFFLAIGNPSLPPSEAWAVRDGMCPSGVGAATTIADNGQD